MRALQRRGEGDAEFEAAIGEEPAGGARLAASEIGQRDIGRAGEDIGEVPFALSVADEHKQAVSQNNYSVLSPRTSAMV